MTEREDKTPVAPSGAAEEQEILLDSPIVEGCPKSPRARRRLGRKRKHCPRPPLAVSLRPPSILLPGRKKSRKKNGP